MDEDKDQKYRVVWLIAATCSALVLVIAAGSLFALREQLRTQWQADATEQNTAREKLTRRMDAMQSTLDRLNAEPKTDAASLNAMGANIAETTTKLDGLATRLEAVEKAVSEKKSDPAPVTVTSPTPDRTSDYAALKVAVLSGKPFASELAAWVKRYPAYESATAPLSDIALHGLTDEAELIRQLIEKIDRKPEATLIDDTSLFGKINTHLKGLVHIQKTAPDPYAKLRNDALHGDISTIMRDVEGLNDTDRAPLHDWLTHAKQRSVVLDTLTSLATLTPTSSQ